MDKKKLEEIYDSLYQLADDIIKEHNPCEVSKDGCLADENFCCHECKHLSKTGCRVKALWCKVYLCSTSRIKYPIIADALEHIQSIASYYQLLSFRAGKKRSIMNAIDRLNIHYTTLRSDNKCTK